MTAPHPKWRRKPCNGLLTAAEFQRNSNSLLWSRNNDSGVIILADMPMRLPKYDVTMSLYVSSTILCLDPVLQRSHMSVLLTTFSVCVKIPLKKWKINSISFVHVKGTKYKNNNSRNNDKIIIIINNNTNNKNNNNSKNNTTNKNNKYNKRRKRLRSLQLAHEQP